MKLVANWRSAPRWISMWCMAIGGALSATWILLPPEYQAKIPPEWVMKGTAFYMLVGVIGRLFKQGPNVDLPAVTQASIEDLKDTAATLKDASKTVDKATAKIESAAADQTSGS